MPCRSFEEPESLLLQGLVVKVHQTKSAITRSLTAKLRLFYSLSVSVWHSVSLLHCWSCSSCAFRVVITMVDICTICFNNKNFALLLSSSSFLLVLLLPLALQPAVGFGLSNNILPFFPICRQLSPSPHA